jgi:hypothetical protein
MLEALQLVREQHPFLLEVVDVDADPALVAQYDELVPVLTGSGNGASARELCHYFLDEKKVRDFLISCQNEK